MPSVKKYKLKKVEAGSDEEGGTPVCAFFALPQGCRNGSACPFLHDGQPTQGSSSSSRKATTTASTTKNIQAMKEVRKEIHGNEESKKKRHRAAAASPSPSPAARKKAKTRQQQDEDDETTSTEGMEDEASSPVPKKAAATAAKKTTPAGAAAAKKASPSTTGGLNPFLALASPPPSSAVASAVSKAAKVVKSAVSVTEAQARPTRQQQQQQQAQKKAAPAAAPTAAAGGAAAGGGGGKGLAAKLSSLPIKPFSIARTEEKEKAQTKGVKKAVAPVVNKEKPKQRQATRHTHQPVVFVKKQEESEEVAEEEEEEVEASSEEEVEEEDAHAGCKWSSCVKATVKHNRFAGDYRAVVTSNKGVAEWIETKKHGPWCKDLPHVLAIDCEMCATRDPVSNEQDGKALIRLSVVNGHDEKEVLLDTLVLPSLPVVDYRTDIHGIRPQDLQSVMFTFRHAQAAMLQVCCSETVLIGHGLCNDLTALKMKHQKVVDTALLFEREDAPHHTPALKDVASALLGFDMPEMHDSVADAQATLRVARHFLEQGPVAPVPRLPTTVNKKGRRLEALQTSLLLHRIPSQVTDSHIVEMFHSRTHVMPVSVDPVVLGAGGGSETFGRTTAHFLSKKHADLAFHTLSGPARPDKDGRPQKRVYLATKKDYMQVRLFYAPNVEQKEEGGGRGRGGRDGDRCRHQQSVLKFKVRPLWCKIMSKSRFEEE